MRVTVVATFMRKYRKNRFGRTFVSYTKLVSMKESVSDRMMMMMFSNGFFSECFLMSSRFSRVASRSWLFHV